MILMKGEAQPGSLLMNIDAYVDRDNDVDVGDGDDGHHDHGHDNDEGRQVVDPNEGGDLAGISHD